MNTQESGKVTVDRDAAIRIMRHEDTFEDRTALKLALQVEAQTSEDDGERATVVMSDEDRERLREIAHWAEKRGMIANHIAFLHHLADDSPLLFAAELDRKLILDHLDSHGEEAVEIGTKALLEALTEVCPGCGGDDSGGGADEPAYSCAHCESRKRVPAQPDPKPATPITSSPRREPTMPSSPEQTVETVFEMGQRVNVYTEEDRFICVGDVDGIHYPREPDGEEFYDVQPVGTPGFGHLDRISEMRLTEATHA